MPLIDLPSTFFFWSSPKKALAFWPKTAICPFLMYRGVNSVFNLTEAAWASNGSSHHPFFEGWPALGALTTALVSFDLPDFSSTAAMVTGTEMEAPVQPAVEDVFPSAYWDLASSQEKTCSASAFSLGRFFGEHHISEPWEPVVNFA